MTLLVFGMLFVNKKNRLFIEIIENDIKEFTKDTSQHQAAFFHKFGLVRLSLNPGVLTPGFFIY